MAQLNLFSTLYTVVKELKSQKTEVRDEWWAGLDSNQ